MERLPNHYKTLELVLHASEEEIQTAHRRLSAKYHPDNTETGDQGRFEAVNLAYGVLSDAAQRSLYRQMYKDQVCLDVLKDGLRT